MKCMRAVNLTEPGKMEMAEVPEPQPRGDEVVIGVGAVGICGSDVRYYHGENPWALHTLGHDVEQITSFTLGHEVAGSISKVGEWSGENRLGERVGVLAFKGCGECYFCRRDLPNLCAKTLHIGHDGTWPEDVDRVPGGYADYMKVWADKAIPIPDNVSFKEATQLDGLGVAVHANDIGDVSPGDTVAVIGSSAIGLLIEQVAQVRGAKEVVALDVWDLPLEIAEDLGADSTINVSEEERVIDRLKSTNDGRGPDVVFDTVGMEGTFRQGVKSMSRKGTYVTLAVTDREVNMNLTDIGGEKTIVSSANNKYKDYPVGVDLLSSGMVEVEPFITHVMSLDEYEEAFQMLENKKEHDAIKIVLVP